MNPCCPRIRSWVFSALFSPELRSTQRYGSSSLLTNYSGIPRCLRSLDLVTHPLHNLCRPERCSIPLSILFLNVFQCGRVFCATLLKARVSQMPKLPSFSGTLHGSVAATLLHVALHLAALSFETSGMPNRARRTSISNPRQHV